MLLFCGVFLLAIGAYVYVFEPLLTRYETAAAAITAEQDEINKASRAKRMLALRRQKFREAREEANRLLMTFGGVVPAEERLGVALGDFQRAASTAHVALGQVRPVDVAQDEASLFSAQSFELEFNGNYADVLRMVYLLESGRNLLLTRQFDMTREGALVRARMVASRLYLKNDVQLPEVVSAVPGARVLRVGVKKRVGLGGLFLADRLGYLRNDKAAVSLITMPAVMDFYRNGDMDALALTGSEFLTLAAEGYPVTVVAGLCQDDQNAAVIVPAVSTVRAIESLNGQKVGVQKGRFTHYALFRLLEARKQAVSMVNIVEMDQVAAMDAVLAGELDAAVVAEPWLSKALSSGKARVLDDPVLKNGSIELLAVHPALLEQAPEAVALLVEGALRGMDYWREHPAEGNSLVAEALWSAPEDVVRFLQTTVLLDRAANGALLGAQKQPAALPDKLGHERRFLEECCGYKVPEESLRAFTPRFIETGGGTAQKERP
jgi:NitT/TauT family transport system substrate-binding protein